MRRIITVFSLLLAMVFPAHSQILGAELVPSQDGENMGFIGTSYHYCSDTLSPTDSFTAYIVYGKGDTLIQEFRAIAISIDTLQDCSNCGCSTNCETPAIVRTRFTYSFNPQQLGIKNACHIRAFFSPGLRASDIDFAPKAQTTNLLVSAFINTCGNQQTRNFEFALPPKFYGIQSEYFIHSSGFQQIFTDSILQFDSLSATTVKPYSSPFTTIDYRNGYDNQNPLLYNGYPNTSNAFPRGFHVNQATGDYRFIPTDTGTSLLKVGFTAHDSSITAYAEREWVVRILASGTETVPVLTGLGMTSFLDASNYEYNLCFNDTSKAALRVIDKDGPGIDFEYTTTPALASNFQWSISNDTVYLRGSLDSIYTAERPLRLFLSIGDSSCTAGNNSSYTVLLYNNPFPKVAPSITYTGQRAFALKSNPLQPASVTRYQWHFNGNTYGKQDTTALLKQPGTYKYRHIAYGTRGCNDTLSSSYQTPDFPYISINETLLEPCAGDTVGFSVSFFHAPAPPNYTWLNKKGGKNIDIIVTKDTIVTIKAEFLDGTINYDTTWLKVTPAPLPQILQYTQHCEGNILTLEAQYPNAGFNDSALQYQWTFNNRKVGELPDVQIQDEGALKLAIEYSNGCTRTNTENIVYDLIYNPGPILYPYCPSEDSIHFEIDTLEKLTSYWYLNRIQVAQGINKYTMGNLDKNNEIVLVSLYIDSNIYCRFIDTLQSERLVEDQVFFNGSVNFCEYDSLVDFKDSSFITPTYGVWLDSLNNQVSLTDGRYFDPATIPLSRSQKLVYEVEHPTSQCIVQKTINIKVFPRPGITYLIDTLELCVENPDYPMNNSQVVVPPSGTWSGDGIIVKNGEYYFSTLSGIGVEKVNKVNYTLTDSYGCQMIDSSAVQLGLGANPVVLSATTGEVPITISFTDDRTNLDCEVESWLWNFGDHMALPNCTTNIDTLLKEDRYCAYGVGKNVQHIYRDGGQYKVKLFVKNSNTGAVDSAVYNALSLTVGIDENGFQNDEVVVYPNPVQTHFTISQAQRQPYAYFELQNLMGQSILTQKLFSETQRTEVAENLQGLLLLVLYNQNGEAVGHHTLLFE